MKTSRITEIVNETLRKGGIDKFPASALESLIQDIEPNLEADAVKRIRKFMTPALIAKAVSHSYSKRTSRVSEAPSVAGPTPATGIPPLSAREIGINSKPS